jgi:hypothetical protein
MENINFPAINVKPDKNGKINTSAELFMTVITANTPEVLKQYTTVQFAEAVVSHYNCSNKSVNGACQFLRGVVSGSKLDFEFEFSDARPVGAITALRAQNEKLINALKAQGMTDAEIDALLNK